MGSLKRFHFTNATHATGVRQTVRRIPDCWWSQESSLPQTERDRLRSIPRHEREHSRHQAIANEHERMNGAKQTLSSAV
jgi:hypothetical protein